MIEYEEQKANGDHDSRAMHHIVNQDRSSFFASCSKVLLLIFETSQTPHKNTHENRQEETHLTLSRSLPSITTPSPSASSPSPSPFLFLPPPFKPLNPATLQGPVNIRSISSTVYPAISGTSKKTYKMAIPHQAAKKINAPQLSVSSSREGSAYVMA